jgi:hypothetical protein
MEHSRARITRYLFVLQCRIYPPRLHRSRHLHVVMPTVSVQNRRVLAPRPLRNPFHADNSPLKATRVVSTSTKRPRSPELPGELHVNQTSPKRAKAAQPSPSRITRREEDRKNREQRKTEREAQKAEFRVKYTRAFPSFVFHFDLDTLDPESAATRRNLEAKVISLGAVCFMYLPKRLSPIPDTRYGVDSASMISSATPLRIS